MRHAGRGSVPQQPLPSFPALRYRQKEGLKLQQRIKGYSLVALSMGAFLLFWLGSAWLTARLWLPALQRLFVQEAVILLVAVALPALDGLGLRGLGLKSSWLGPDLLAVFGLIGVQWVGSFLTSALLQGFGRAQPQQALQVLNRSFGSLRPGPFLAVALGLALLAGVSEELLFRGYLISRLERAGLRDWGAALVSALLFGLVHWPGYGIWPALSKGLWFGVPTGLYFVRRRNLAPLIAAHTLLDFTAFVMLYLVLRSGLQPIVS